jgi:cobalt-zinc-cadmium efflux system membrane fusion protein
MKGIGMKSDWRGAGYAAVLLAALTGCKAKQSGDTAPPPVRVVEAADMNVIRIDSKSAGYFPVVQAESMQSAAELSATGTVSPDIAREVPVISLANGRVVDIRARLDDQVRKGQLLFSVQSPDVSTAFNAYQKAENDERLARTAYQRAEDLFQHGAIAQSALDQAEDAAKDAKSDLNAAQAQLHLLGVDRNHPGSVVHVYAPISGVIVSQNVTNAAAAGVALSGSSTAFTIADLSTVWILCDVNENDLSKLTLGQQAQVHIDAYPDRPLTGRVSDIGPVLDPSTRTAKVRVELKNPGMLRLGMFVTAKFTSTQKSTFAVVPTDAVLHLHDRDWVYVPAGGSQFRRVEVRAGQMLEGNRQQILSGITPGQAVVTHALMLETAGNQ